MTTDETRARSTDADAQSAWGKARPEFVPRPTYAPAAMAFGVTLLAWGPVTSPVVAGAGLAVLVASLVGWIREMRHET